MSSVQPILEGSVAAKPFVPQSGAVRGFSQAGTVSGDGADSPENAAVAELNGLISSIGSLSAQAQSLPLSAPTLPGLPQSQSYRPQATDYTQLADDSN
jgi:hypothetical protein